MNTLSKWGLGAGLSFGLGLALTLSASFAMAAAQELDSIAAIVNDDIVLQTDVNTRLGKIKQQFKNSNTQAPDIETLKSQVLDQLIIENLQLQLAAKKGVYIADPSLELAIESIAKNNQMSLDQLTQAITDSGETMIQFRDRIRQELTINEIQKSAVDRRIRISEHEVDRYLASNKGQQLADTEYDIGHILIGLSAQPDAKELTTAQQKLDAIAKAFDQGTEFASLAALNGVLPFYAMPHEVLPCYFEPVPTTAMIEAKKLFEKKKDWSPPFVKKE